MVSESSCEMEEAQEDDECVQDTRCAATVPRASAFRGDELRAVRGRGDVSRADGPMGHGPRSRATRSGRHGDGRFRPKSGTAGTAELRQSGIESGTRKFRATDKQPLANGLPGELRSQFPW